MNASSHKTPFQRDVHSSQKHTSASALTAVFQGILWILAIFAAGWLLGPGPLHWTSLQPETHLLWLETGVLFLLLFAILYWMKGWARIGLLAALALLFCYLHIVILPALLTLAYLAYACLLGRAVRHRFRLSVSVPLFADSLFGYSSLLVLFAGFSAIGFGEIAFLQKFVLGSGILLLLFEAGTFRAELLRRKKADAFIAGTRSVYVSFCLALIGTMLLLEAGRMNLSLDFDSLWYGVRSEYILNNGAGIYENLGSMGVVYTYSKGLEILTLPLSNLPSHSYLAFCGLWFMVLLLYAAYLTACEWTDKKTALLVPLLLATMPAVMNLTLSVKTDTITLLFQVIMLYYLVRYLKHRSLQDFLLAGCSLVFSWTLKPTGLLFGSAAFGMSMLYFLYHRMFPKGRCRKWGYCLVMFGALFAVCARTVLLTGVPFTSIFTGIFTKIGFTLKYPFNVESVPFSAASLTAVEKLARVGKRSLMLLFCPMDAADMAHVVCAWGGLVLVLAAVWCMLAKTELVKKKAAVERGESFRKKEVGGRSRIVRKEETSGREEMGKYYFAWMLLPLTLANLLSFWQLKQIDGNYYNLYYVLALLAGCRMAAGKKRLAVPVIALNLLLCTVSSTSWQIGMTPIAWKNKGYYPHEAMEEQRIRQSGNEEIWDILAKDERTRVLVIGDHPSMLAFPCNTQSYYDVAGSWGNKNLVKSTESFCQFLAYAKTDYLYVQANWMAETAESYRLVRELTACGVLEDFLFENGNMLAKVQPEAVQSLAQEMMIQETMIQETMTQEAMTNLERIRNEYAFYMEESLTETTSRVESTEKNAKNDADEGVTQ